MKHDPNPRLRLNWSNYSPKSSLFIKIQKARSSEFKHQFLPVNRQNLTLKHSVNVEMSVEAIGSKRFKGFGV